MTHARESKLNATQKICPTCNKENEEHATVCKHCGAKLDEISTKYVGVSDPSINAPAWQKESSIDVELMPEEGIGIQVAGETKPIYVPISWELIIGRKMDATSTQELLNIGKMKAAQAPDFLDLSPMHASTLGVSRRHIMIRRTLSGYEVTDLSSRNGSWLNGERLVPNKPYPLHSGSQLLIGRMRLLIMYRSVKK